MKEKIDDILQKTLKKCFEKGLLKECPLPTYLIEIPNNNDHGHFATNLALTLASPQRRRPREIAEIIADNLEDKGSIFETVETAGAGFINFRIRPEEWHRLLIEITEKRDRYGSIDRGTKEKINIEFVSANPTGPLHLGHGRGAALGDTICRILSFRGHEVVREFYINDAGLQIRILGESIYSRWMQKKNPAYPFPDNGYHGDYITDLAEDISTEVDLSSMEPEKAIEICSKKGKERMLAEINNDLGLFRTQFDVWFTESDLFSNGLVERSLKEMEARKELYEKDGALWIKTSDFGDDKDRVLRKSDGQFTYFASDISYHLDKHGRGFSKAIDIWGADHHGYIPRMQSAMKANGIDENWLSVILIQLVKLFKEGREIKMSKRAGQYVTLRELLDEVGVDAARFIFLTKAHDSQLDFDIDLVKKHDTDNPVYYVQYAHARVCSIFKKAEAEGISIPSEKDLVLDTLTLDEEISLIRLMEEFPSLLDEICASFDAHRLTYYLADLAARFHKYFNLGLKNSENRIVTADIPLSQARLILADAVRIVIKTGLNLLGVNAPERM
ncbi:MAG: arginine--tRNA ligase [Deltaproteobacteria bacterium]|nr:arginine--tRNA ligase [Deltaproteobacteria bacterium]